MMSNEVRMFDGPEEMSGPAERGQDNNIISEAQRCVSLRHLEAEVR